MISRLELWTTEIPCEPDSWNHLCLMPAGTWNLSPEDFWSVVCMTAEAVTYLFEQNGVPVSDLRWEMFAYGL